MNPKGKIESNVDLLRDFIKRVFSFGRDKVMALEDETEKLIKKLVEKGQLTEDEGRRIFDELLSKARKDSQELVEGIESKVRQTFTPVIPARADLDEIRREVADLAARVDQLLAERDGISVDPALPARSDEAEAGAAENED